MYRPPDIDEMKNLRDQAVGGEDFADARPRLLRGHRGRQGRRQGLGRPGPARRAPASEAIFDDPGRRRSARSSTSRTRGLFLYKVLEERTQTPDADQLETIKASAFQNWYGEKKDAVTITRELLDDLAQSS